MEYDLNKPTRYMREIRCALADIFTKFGTNTNYYSFKVRKIEDIDLEEII